VPKEAILKEAISKEAISKEAIPKEAIPKEAIPKEAIPRKQFSTPPLLSAPSPLKKNGKTSTLPRHSQGPILGHSWVLFRGDAGKYSAQW
jgi:hypothetical protein